ncbi:MULTISPECIES: TetR/AcrR family transcriptional regulator [Brevibacterium]|uniref:HTH tetR-type domain-containing protein n=1 Tax=Brevibacterium salitolerans TaxID=1403566 RepID=A0ABP5I3Q7_9MICO|nr:TetR/AcrR family transcriptional regulator [Brevibacterium sp.]
MARPVDPARAAQRRAAIIGAAAQLFAMQGYASTSAAQIARAAGVSSGTVFYHFGDKAAVFRAIFEADRPDAEAALARASAFRNPLTGALWLLEQQAADAGSPYAAGLVVELLRRAGEDPQLLEVVEGTAETLRTGLAEMLRSAAERGLVADLGDPEAAAAWLLAIVDAAFLNGGEGRDVTGEVRRTALGYLGAGDPGAGDSESEDPGPADSGVQGHEEGNGHE